MCYIEENVCCLIVQKEPTPSGCYILINNQRCVFRNGVENS